MKLLLDENLPKRLKRDLAPHDVFTVREMGWNGIKNGELLGLIFKNGFDALLTFDKNLAFQQNFQKYPVAVIGLVAEDNTYLTLRELIPLVVRMLRQPLKPGVVVVRNIE